MALQVVTSIKMIRDCFYIVEEAPFESLEAAIPPRLCIAEADAVFNVGDNDKEGEIPFYTAERWLSDSDAAPHTINGNPIDGRK